MAFRLPNGSSFYFEATSSEPVTITAISNAAEAVVSAALHDVVAGDVVVITSGWTRITGRAFKVKSVVADVSFVLEKLDTTDVTRFPAGASAGSFYKVETWVNIPQIMEVASSGGDQQFYTFAFLEEDEQRQLPTSKNPSTLTLTIADDPTQAYVPIVEKADELKATRVQRLNLVNGDEIYYNSVASITNTPTLTRDQLMQRVITLAQQGRVTRYQKSV
jgi:hypothetical protein